MNKQNRVYYTTEYYLAKKEMKFWYVTIWMNPENIFSEVSQTQSTNIV